jgi:hypothetical protein
MNIIPPRRPRGKLLTIEEKRLAARVYYEVLAETALDFVPTKGPFLRTCKYTGLSSGTLQPIRMEWQQNQDFADVPSGRRRIDQRTHWSRLWMSDIRQITMDLNAKGVPVTIRKIVKEMNERLRDYGHILSRKTCERLLRKMEFKYNEASKTVNVEETRQIKEWREKYLEHRDKVRTQQPEAIELWLDESYCNQFHTGARSWFRPGDFVRRGKRGRRWVIVHCGGADGWIGKPLVFEAKSGTGDYHKNMSAEVFEEYFAELCSDIILHYPEERLSKGVYIYMDNAAYHKRVKGLEGGISKLRKSELIEWMKQCDPALTDETFAGKKKADIYNMCKDEPQRFRGTTIVEQIAKDAGFNMQVVWLPPYHPMLNPIELGWATTKGHVADVNDGRDFKMVRTYIYEGFEKVTPEVWSNLVRRTYKNEDELIEKHSIITQKKLDELSHLIIEFSDSDSDSDSEEWPEEDEEECDDLDLDDLVGDEEITDEFIDEFSGF